MMDKNWAYISKLIDDNAIGEIVEICQKMKAYDYQVIKNKLIQELRITDIIVRRNTIAIVLSDLKCDEAIEALVDLINDSKNKNCRGTLIYALQELKCEDVIISLIPVMFDGNWEVRYNMYNLLSEKFKYLCEADQLECVNLLRKEKNKLEEELELLENVEKNIFKIK